MTPQALNAAADALASLRLRRGVDNKQLDELPDALRPRSLEDAYALQEHTRTRLETLGAGKPCGWKIGCTTPVMQEYLSIDHPCAGTLYANSVHETRTSLAITDFFQLGLECELAVRLARDVPVRRDGYDAASIAPFVESVMTSIEIVDHRFRDLERVSTPTLVADDFFSCGCVVGTAIALARVGDPAALTGGFSINGEPPRLTGQGAAILGHPLSALAWLADHLATRGTSLAQGEIVTLGSVVKTIYPGAGTQVVAAFEGLCPVSIEIN